MPTFGAGAPQAPVVFHTVSLKTGQDISTALLTSDGTTRARNEIVNKIWNYLSGIAHGTLPGDLFVDIGDTAARTWWTITNGSGTVGVSIQGTAVTVTATAFAAPYPTQAAADYATAQALAAAVNAQATLKNWVRAAADPTFTTAGRVVFTFRFPGTVANIYTFATSGAGTTQAVSGATFGAGGTAPAIAGAVGASAYFDYYGYDTQGR